jgi:MoxR-like ATPase
MNKLMNILLMNGFHPMFCGPTGTGKSISIASELKNSFNTSDYTYIALSFSA